MSALCAKLAGHLLSTFICICKGLTACHGQFFIPTNLDVNVVAAPEGRRIILDFKVFFFLLLM